LKKEEKKTVERVRKSRHEMRRSYLEPLMGIMKEKRNKMIDLENVENKEITDKIKWQEFWKEEQEKENDQQDNQKMREKRQKNEQEKKMHEEIILKNQKNSKKEVRRYIKNRKSDERLCKADQILALIRNAKANFQKAENIRKRRKKEDERKMKGEIKLKIEKSMEKEITNHVKNRKHNPRVCKADQIHVLIQNAKKIGKKVIKSKN